VTAWKLNWVCFNVLHLGVRFLAYRNVQVYR
jgi:hypothetical protein